MKLALACVLALCASAHADEGPFGEASADDGPCYQMTLDSRHIPEPTGTPVKVRRLTPPAACKALATKPHAPYRDNGPDAFGDPDTQGLQVFETAAEFRKRFRCAASGVDFKRERVAIFWIDDDTKATYEAEAVDDDSKHPSTTAIIRTSHPCAKSNKLARRVLMFALPKREEYLVGLAICPKPEPTCP